MTPRASRAFLSKRAVLFLLLSGLPGQATDRSDLGTHIDAIASAAVKQKKTAGVSLTVLQGSDVLASRGYGSADLENDVPVTAGTVFPIGSITKQFTAAATLDLVDEGRLSLNDSLGRLLPEVPVAWRGVTVRQLLNHTSGIRSMTSLGPKYWAQAGREITPAELVAIFANEPVDFPPGTRYAYSNSGYVLLGVVLEKLTGRRYGEVLDERFFKALCLRRTFYGVTQALVKNRARGYSIGKDGFENAWFVSLSQGFAAGGICSTSPELATWTRTLHTKPPMSAASYRRMVTPETLPDGTVLSYGYGVGVGELDGHRFIWHGGGLPGFDSYAVFFPGNDLTVVLLANTDGGDIAMHIGTAIARLLLRAPPD